MDPWEFLILENDKQLFTVSSSNRNESEEDSLTKFINKTSSVTERSCLCGDPSKKKVPLPIPLLLDAVVFVFMLSSSSNSTEISRGMEIASNNDRALSLIAHRIK